MLSLDGVSAALPAGRVVHAGFWLSDGPVPPGLWAALRAAHPSSGLWPLLLTPLNDDEGFRPWGNGEVEPGGMSSPSAHDAEAVLARWWARQLPVDGAPTDMVAPFGAEWPGRSPRLASRTDPDELADELSEVLASFDETTRIGLFPAARGADAITSAGWLGPVNYVADTALLSAVLRDWEDRFGARLLGAGFATLQVSVAAPPSTREEALRVAAEHLAFCPDNILQGDETGALAGYADHLVGRDTWHFWWD